MHRPSCATEQLAQVSKDRYVEFRSILPSAKPHQVQPRVHQSPPPPDLFKIIYDGAVFADKNKSGIGVVIQDNHGLVIASLVQHKLINRLKLKPWQPPRVLEFGLEIGIDKAMVEARRFHYSSVCYGKKMMQVWLHSGCQLKMVLVLCNFSHN